MTKEEKVRFLVNIHTDLGPLPMSLEEKCIEILNKMEDAGLLRLCETTKRSMKGVC